MFLFFPFFSLAKGKEFDKGENMIISKTIEIDMGHRLYNHQGKCKNFHGHRYKIEVGVEGYINKTTGMVVDFFDLKHMMNEVIDEKLDHGFMICDVDPLCKMFEQMCSLEKLKLIIVPFNPTVEHISIYIQNMLVDKGLTNIKYVKIRETPSSCAFMGVNK